MGISETVILGLLLFICCLIGHIVGYRTRIKDEMVGKISIVCDKKDIETFKRIIAVYYKGELAEDVEVRAIDSDKENAYKSPQNKNNEDKTES